MKAKVAEVQINGFIAQKIFLQLLPIPGHDDKPIISGCKMTLKVANIAILAVVRGLYLKSHSNFFGSRLMSCEDFGRIKLLTMDIYVIIWACGSRSTGIFKYLSKQSIFCRI